jgi:hypothetical protein
MPGMSSGRPAPSRCPQPPDRAAFARRRADLGCYGFDRGDGDVLRTTWEAALGLEQFAQHGEAEACGTTLVAEQGAIGGM